MKTKREIKIAMSAIANCVFELGRLGDVPVEDLDDHTKESIAQMMQVAGVLAWVLDERDCPTFDATERLIDGMILAELDELPQSGESLSQ